MAVLIDQLTLGELKILALDSDPRDGVGYSVEVGSYATINNQSSPVGKMFIKVGPGSTDWNIIATEESNGTVEAGQARRLALYPSTDNLVDDVLVENSQNVTVDIAVQSARTTPINYRIPNPGDAITAADFVLTEGDQTINGDKTFNDDIIIQGDLTVNGTLTYLATTNTTIEDKLITLNKGGLADSGGETGFEIEEDGLITGYFKTEVGATSDAWLLKATDSNELKIDLSPLTDDRQIQIQDRDGYVALQTAAALTEGSVIFVDSDLRLAEDNNNFFWDAANQRLGLNTAAAPEETLHVAGNVRVSGSGSNLRLLAESDFQIQQSTVNTTDATATEIASIPVPNNSSLLLEIRVIGRRTGGTGGSTGDSAHYIRTARYKNISGAVSVHSVQSDYTSEDQAGWGIILGVNGSNARVQVTGAANNNVTWEATILRMVVD